MRVGGHYQPLTKLWGRIVSWWRVRDTFWIQVDGMDSQTSRGATNRDACHRAHQTAFSRVTSIPEHVLEQHAGLHSLDKSNWTDPKVNTTLIFVLAIQSYYPHFPRLLISPLLVHPLFKDLVMLKQYLPVHRASILSHP